jgi:5'-AMP-activated protein kinase catalytic alpha subunit
MIQGKTYKALPADIWSCGVILFVMVCGYLPFEDTNTTNLYKKILAASYKLPKFVSFEVSELIKGILNTDPRKRYTIEDIRRHPWYQTYKVTYQSNHYRPNSLCILALSLD